ncbi:cilia- and flagella-associated protein 206 [Hypomesus transpacificus]|uniref:cilia- and flagella-associated protein 206 n=1 Tax=Hypomesus transpacificus TaxID=137520 RepID=UPI001F0881E2|nr:cilia- and flagella-associated protein 206 [Hypomesus transpacificus]
MSRAQAESVIKNIIREIAQECAGKGHAVLETLVAFMVKAVVLDPRNQFNVDRTLTKQDVRKLVELCVDKLMDQGSPTLDTIKMQVYFDMNYTSRNEFINEHHRVLQSKLIPVSREITDSRVKTRDDLEGLYRKIVSYVLLRSGLGSPTDINTVREATAALQSVFPQSELGTFLSLIKKDKEQQLNELSMIVTGIRLFNKDSKKGGEGIEDLPAILNVSIPAAGKDIQWELELSQNLAWQYTAILEKLLDSVEARDCMVPLEQLKQALYNVRQHESFLKIILSDVILCAKKVEALQNDLATCMKLLREAVHSKTAVPTAHVFPHFTALAQYWSGLQDEMVLLSILGNLLINLQPFLTAQSRMFSDVQLESLLEGSEVKSDEQRMTESSENRVEPSANKRYEWIFPETTANFDELPIQYKGICGYMLVETNGILLPGNPSIGVLKHREKYYVFSSRDAALCFASKADEYIVQVAEKAKCSPELIQLLELHQQFSSVSPYSKMQSGDRLLVKPITKCDSCTQTDTHLLETNIFESYEWNEWELRRKAIKLANLRSRVTHSMQTNLSHMRRDNVTQTYLLKDVACQSRKDGTSNIPKPQVYLAGLRGEKNKTTRMIKTNLTRSIDE